MSDKITHRKANKVMTRDRLTYSGFNSFFNDLIDRAKDIENKARAMHQEAFNYMEELSNVKVEETEDHDDTDHEHMGIDHINEQISRAELMEER